MSTVSVMWFRRDLRLGDNPALVEAVRTAQQVVPLFVVDDRLCASAGANRLAFLVGCLRRLDEELDGRLVVRRGDPVEAVAALVGEVGATAVFTAEDFGPYGRRRDDAVERALELVGACLVRVGSAYAVEPGTVLNGAGAPYRVFTPFHRAWKQAGWAEPLRRPTSVRWVDGLRSDELSSPRPSARSLPEPGEDAGLGALDRFVGSHVERYAQRRDEPGVDGTSRLSPYLRWGCLHPRQVLARLGEGEGEDMFRAELAWREFYADVLFNHPASAHSALQERMSHIAVDQGPETDEAFNAWCEGRTGYPIVDAGMRQLLAEGWMHNRVRMITASFLVKDLHLDWTRGARHFMAHLVDGDLASNQHGWQWVAGTGTDAAPYFRVFNPVGQSRRFDRSGAYLRTWLPELAHLDDRAVHEPWTLAEAERATIVGYPERIVDHDEERREALARYEELRRRR